jgi:hypothetical protein
MHHRREGYPFGSLVDFAPDSMGRKSFFSLLVYGFASIVQLFVSYKCLTGKYKVTPYYFMYLSIIRFSLFDLKFQNCLMYGLWYWDRNGL